MVPIKLNAAERQLRTIKNYQRTIYMFWSPSRYNYSLRNLNRHVLQCVINFPKFITVIYNFYKVLSSLIHIMSLFQQL